MKTKKTALISLNNVRVLIEEKTNYWFAQCLDIDYCAQGVSMNDVKQNFEDGLLGSIKANIDTFGSLDNFLIAPPFSVRKNLLNHSHHKFNCIAEYDLKDSLPTYDKIQFFIKDNVAAA